MSRRRFLGLSAAGTAAAAIGVGGYASLVEPRRVRFTRHVAKPRTSPAQREVTFAQVTDLHLQHVGGMHRRMAARVNALRPDFVLFTGDAVDRPGKLGELRSLLALFDPRTPKYAILGNWEHWAGVDLDELASLYRAVNCRLLVNDFAIHEIGGRSIRLTGLDDLLGGKPDPARALAGPADADAHLVLAHCPEHRDRLGPTPPPVAFKQASPPSATFAGATLMLSGHTHGGQVNLFGWAPILPQGSGRYVRGWFRDAGQVPMYVSRGIGTSMAPVRLGAPPEVAVFTMWV